MWFRGPAFGPVFPSRELENIMLRRLAAVMVAVVAVGLLAGPASAFVLIDANFAPGAQPSDFNYTTSATPDYTGDVWNNTGGFTFNGTANGVPAALQPDANGIWSGRVELSVQQFSGAADDQTVFGMARHTEILGAGNEYGFLSYYLDGAFRVYTNGPTDVPVANQDGAVHAYGFVVDETARNIKLYFDYEQVGEPGGYNMTGNVFGESLSYFGDGTGGQPHASTWELIVVGSGPEYAIPEPASLVLMGLGGLMMARRRR